LNLLTKSPTVSPKKPASKICKMAMALDPHHLHHHLGWVDHREDYKIFKSHLTAIQEWVVYQELHTVPPTPTMHHHPRISSPHAPLPTTQTYLQVPPRQI
jgi:hypothetical protein